MKILAMSLEELNDPARWGVGAIPHGKEVVIRARFGGLKTRHVTGVAYRRAPYDTSPESGEIVIYRKDRERTYRATPARLSRLITAIRTVINETTP